MNPQPTTSVPTRSFFSRWLDKQPAAKFTLRTCGDISRLVAIIPTYFYVLWLGLNFTFRHVLATSASIALVFASGMFVLEAGAALLHPSLAGHHPPNWIKISIVVLALFMVYHRVREFSDLKRKPLFLSNTNVLLTHAATLDFKSEDPRVREERLNTFIAKVLVGIGATFNGSRSVQLNVMFPDEDGRLRILCNHPDTANYDGSLELKHNVGGAGIALARNSIVYIPRISVRHGILISLPTGEGPVIDYSLLPFAYVPAHPEPYKAILSAPIRSADGRAVGVLNLDLKKSNPFSEFDFLTAQVAASFIGMALDRYESSS